MCASREGVNNFERFSCSVKSNGKLDRISITKRLEDPQSDTRDNLNGSVTCKIEQQQQQQQQQEKKSADEADWLHRTARKVPCFGILLAFAASFFLGTAGMLVKLTDSVHGIQVAVIRALIQLIVYLGLIWYRKLALMPAAGELIPVLMRVTLGAASITCSYFALKLIPLGDATVIRFSLPIWTLIVGYLVLHESCGLLKVLAVIVSLSGVSLMAKPAQCVYLMHRLLNSLNLESDVDFQLNLESYTRRSGELVELTDLQQESSQVVAGSTTTIELQEPAGQFEGCMLALASSICLALSLIALRMCRKTPVELTILWLSIFSMILGTVCLLLMGQWSLPDNLPDCAFILLNGLCGAIGQWFISSSLKVEQTGVISLARTLDIQVAFMYSVLLLHEQIQTTSIVGSLLVSSGVLAVVLPKWTCQSAQRKVSSSDLEGNANDSISIVGEITPSQNGNNNNSNNNNKALA